MGYKMLKEIDIKDEKELEHLIVNEPSVVEEGLKIIKHQLPTDVGPSDIIFVDENGRIGKIQLSLNFHLKDLRNQLARDKERGQAIKPQEKTGNQAHFMIRINKK